MSTLPYDLFDVARSADEARRFNKIGNLYHKGQKLVWDGNAVLEELWVRHGGSGLRPDHKDAARRVLGTIMWGEFAAWRVALQLADNLDDMEARMAATSQAHDEARHFYVMHDYLVRATGDFPRQMPRAPERLLAGALYANTMPKKILGMQLQLEVTALTIFHALREANVCPVLSELLVYYEKDEARHVGLGTQILPSLMKRMSVRERIVFTLYSFRMALWSLASLKASEKDLAVLGIAPRRVAVLGKSKFMLVMDELWRLAPDQKSEIGEKSGHAIDAVAELLWPDPKADPSLRARAWRVLSTLRDGFTNEATILDPSVEQVPRSPGASVLN